ncbi:MAG: 2-C-methyl-D-erythritol 2,4-cyclodiphosphate synthase [Oscillospiraceae bacterium]
MKQQNNVAAVIVAAGCSARMGFDKLFFKIEGREVLLLAAEALAASPHIQSLVVVAGQNLPAVRRLFEEKPLQKPLQVVRGGATRTASVAAGVAACGGAQYVAIHDGARPFVSGPLIERTVLAAFETGAAAPAVAVKDTIKQASGGLVTATPPRQSLAAVQTPQVFGRQAFLKALQAVPQQHYAAFTDDCMVMEAAGLPVRLVQGDEANYKITTPQDLPGTKEKQTMQLRIGHGYDVHKLVENRPLIIGGAAIPYEKGLLGHSDADVLLHAVADALLGAAALGDIGSHFPDSDAAYKNADSLVLLQRVGKIVGEAGFAVGNIDATLLCQAPKLAPHIPAMRANIAGALGLQPGSVSVKATTEEGLGFTGAGQGIAAHCVALLQPL